MPDNDFKAALKSANNLDEFFSVFGNYYDLKGTKLGTIQKTVLINNINIFIAASGAKPIKK